VELTAPQPESLEKVVQYGLAKKNGRVFGDTWDAF
jgi:hypothetical protein